MDQLPEPLYAYHTSYFSRAFGDLDRIAVELSNRTQHAELEFDTIVGTGMSGALVIPQVAKFLNVRWALIRKEKSPHSSWTLIVGDVGRRWLFVDDLVASGETKRRVKEVIGENVPGTKYVGTYLYETAYIEEIGEG